MASLFSATYTEARLRFLTAAAKAGAVDLWRYPHPLTGPLGEMLATDVAWFGPRDARAVLVTISATHGVEGFCGSAVQADWMQGIVANPLPEGIAALHIHALNPHGFAWIRRVNEDGVDLNRNFVDFAKPLAANPGYAELHPVLLPHDVDETTLAAADAVIGAYGAKHGTRALEMAVSGGQYTHPDGLFYGGTAASWSRRTVETIIEDFALRSRDLVAVVDIHTGLGPFGYGEVICDHPTDSAELARGRAWYGSAMTEPALGTSTSVPKVGLLDYGWMAALGPAVTFVTLEFGTYPVEEMFRQLRADHILHRAGLPDWNDESALAVKAALKRHFCPDDEAWRDMVTRRAREVLGQAQRGLARDA